MDVAYYISELVSQLGGVNVPGLGHFALIKVDGYYDSGEAKFYPPGSKISFDTNFIDDDILTQYIADKKKISLASSKYFTAKYIDSLKQEAIQKDVELANLGWLHFANGNLSFKPAREVTADASFYGYPQIAINKLETKSIYEQIQHEMDRPAFVPVPPLPEPEPDIPLGSPPVKEESVEHKAIELPEVFNTEPEIATPEEEIFAPQPQYFVPKQTVAPNEEEFVFEGRAYVEEKESGSRDWLWISLIVIIVVGIIAVFALYKFKPDEYNKLRGVAPEPVKLKTPIVHDTIKTIVPVVKADSAKDTLKKVVADVPVKVAKVPDNKPASTIDSTKTRYEVVAASTRTLEDANKIVANYNSLHIVAHVINTTPGKRTFKVSLGTYATRNEAIEEINYLINTGKVKDSIWPLQINPK